MSVGPWGGSTEQPGRELVRVLVADDQALFRRGLAMLLDTADGISVVGEAADGQEAVRLATELVPDAVLMDVCMPGLSGLQACAQVRAVVPSARVVMLTVSGQELDLDAAIRAGASGFLLKEMSTAELSTAVRMVAAGQSVVSPMSISRIVRAGERRPPGTG